MTEGTSGNKSSILFVRATRTITNNSAFFRFCWNSRVLVRGKKDFEAARGSFSEQRSVLQASAPLLLDGSDASSLGDGEPDALVTARQAGFARSLKILWAASSAATA